MGSLESGRAAEEIMVDRVDQPSGSKQPKSQPPQADQMQPDPPVMGIVPPNKKPARKWVKQWVPQNTSLNNGKCFLPKWVPEDTVKEPEERPQEEQPQPEPEYEVAFLCSAEGCGRIFTEATAMRKHGQTHMKCPDATKLKRNLLTHTGEKQFVCTFEGCGKVFSSEFNLNQHLKTHSKENYRTCPYEECDKRYAHESKLKAHIRSHHEKNWVPDVKSTALVEKESANPRLLTPIAGAATLDRPFSCPYELCNKFYKHEYKLNLHLRREHAVPAHEENEKQVRTSDVEDEMDEGSEQDENVGKVGIISSSGRGKLRIISKPSPGSSLKRKHSSVAPVDLNIKANPKAPIGRSGLFAKEESEEDSEKTEEDKEDTEDEGWGNRMNIETEDDEDDEETEDERS